MTISGILNWICSSFFLVFLQFVFYLYNDSIFFIRTRFSFLSVPGRTGFFGVFIILKNFLKTKSHELKNLCSQSADATLEDQRALMEEAMAVLGLIVVGVIFFIGLAISSGIVSSINLTGSAFEDASESITTGLTSAYSMGSVLLIVMVAGAIIYALMKSFGGFIFGNRGE